MTEYQDKQAVRNLGTDEWFFIGYEEDETEDTAKMRIYQTNAGDMFAVGIDDDYISFEVVMDDDGQFLVY